MKMLKVTSLLLSSMVALAFYYKRDESKNAFATRDQKTFNKPVSLCGNAKMNWKFVMIDTLKSPVLFDNLGIFEFPVSTTSPEAQTFFNQGIRFYYGFNHAEAYKAFHAASYFDPDCAMAYWGQALAMGPNINMPFMDSTASKTAYQAIQNAASIPGVSLREKALINAQLVRFTGTYAEDRSALDSAYAEAMKTVAGKYPNDPDVLSLTAESVMDIHYWDYWKKDGSPQPWTPEIVANLEKALQLDRNHPGAIHFYIHAMEASDEPEKALDEADRLAALIPGAGHIVHMPSHIYIRTGHYNKGTRSNEQSIEADEAYFKKSYEEGMYSLAYYPHNYHFLWACATLEGNYAKAMKAARDLQSKTNTGIMGTPGMEALQQFYVTPWYAMVRFGRWDDILSEPLRFQELPHVKGISQYARGLAYVRKGNLSGAEHCLREIQALEGDSAYTAIPFQVNKAAQITAIAEKVLAGEIAYKKGLNQRAVALLREAVTLEDELRYMEPADWHQPVRQVLGAVLLEQGKFAEAEKLYREDLETFPENGWSLYGLYASLKGQERTKEAGRLMKQFKTSWKGADVRLTSSRF